MSMPAISQFKRLDVRAAIARNEEPFPAIRAKVDALRPGDGLIVVAPFLPSPLIELLTSEGFASKVERGKGSEWLIYLWRDLN